MKWKWLALLLIFIMPAYAQRSSSRKIDSLVKKLSQTKDDHKRIKILIPIINFYQGSDLPKTRFYEDMALATAKKMNSDTDMCNFYGFIAENYIYKGDFKHAMALLDTEFNIASKDANYKYLGVVYSDRGMIAQEQSNFPAAQDDFFNCLKCGEKINNYILKAISYMNISVTYNGENNFDKSIEYAKKAMAEDPVVSMKAKGFEMMGSGYLQEYKYKEAQKYYQQATINYKKDNDSIGVASMKTLMVKSYPGQYEKQLQLALSAQEIWDKTAPENIYAISNLVNLGSAYGNVAKTEHDPQKNKELLDKSEAYFKRGILAANKTNSRQNVMEITDSIAVIDAERGEFQEAYSNLRKHDVLSDSIYSQDSKNKIASLEGKHEIELKDKQLQINKLELANERKQAWFLVGGVVMLILIAGLIYRQSIQRKNTNTTLITLNQQLDEANKVKTRFFSILNHDLRSPIASFVNFLHLKQQAPDLMDDETQAAYSKKATASAENLLTTMEDLLLWSKGQMENFKPTIKSIPVDALFDYIKKLTENSNVKVTFKNQDGIVLNTDENYVKTIMQNLTTNAIKALGNSASGAIEWKAWEEDNVKYLSITDNGPGATEEQFKALYDESAPIGINSGLGLHIVRDLARAIKCLVSVLPKKSGGVEVKMTFG